MSYPTRIPHKLEERLCNATSKTILFVDYYYFALKIDGAFEFWLNANHYLGGIPATEMSADTLDFLENNCPKFIDFYKNEEYDIDSTVNWEPNTLYPQIIPKIGNAYSYMSYKIVTEKDSMRNKRVIHLHQDWSDGRMADFKTIGEKEVQAFLTLTIFSDTHKLIKSIYDLDCFKNILLD